MTATSGSGQAAYAVAEAARVAVLAQPFASSDNFANRAANVASAASVALYNDTYDRTRPRHPPSSAHWTELMRRLRGDMADAVRTAVPAIAVLRAAARSGAAAA